MATQITLKSQQYTNAIPIGKLSQETSSRAHKIDKNENTAGEISPHKIEYILDVSANRIFLNINLFFFKKKLLTRESSVATLWARTG